MVVVPAWVWRGGPVFRALSLGLAVGLGAGALALLDSGWLAGLAALIAGGALYGILMARRMGKFWPGAKQLAAADRFAVVRAARRGDNIGEARLAPAVIDYFAGLRAAYEQARRYRWVMWLVVAVCLVVAVIDSVFGGIGTAVASWLAFVFFLVELFWWPGREAHLVANAERAEASARQLLG